MPSSEPRLDLFITGGHLYSVAADLTLDVYVYELDDDDAPVFKEVRRFRAGMPHQDPKQITESRGRVDRGDLTR